MRILAVDEFEHNRASLLQRVAQQIWGSEIWFGLVWFVVLLVNPDAAFEYAQEQIYTYRIGWV